MAYTPPGVYTEVEIANNIVQLPGGTRILAFIGNARDYKNIAGEAAMQPIARTTGLQHTPVRSIDGVYDFSNPGGGIRNYPASGATTNAYYGSGFYQVGTGSIAWTAAANQYPTSTTPAVGATYFVTYSGIGASGTISSPVTDTLVQISAHENILSSGTGVYTFLGVSGSSATYYASGTANTTGTDSSGYGRDGSGYNKTSSGTILWGAVNPSFYGYPSTSVPPISGTFFVNYSYYKGEDDYNPQNYTDYNQVVNDYGPDAEWDLVTSGPNAGSYTFRNLNALTLAAQIAFANGASLVSLTQMSGNGLTNGDYSTALDKLQSKTVDIIVPLTVGSGATIGEISLSEKESIFQTVETHCDTMSLPQNKKERVSIVSLGQAEIGDSSTDNTYIFEAGNLLDKRMTLLAPGLTTVQIQDPNGTFQNVQVEAPFLAAAMGALSCNPNFDVATPLTNKSITSFQSISARTSGHPSSSYLESEKNILAAAGICVIDQTGAKIFVRHQLTTDQTNVANGEFSVVTTTDYVSQAVRFTTEQFIGKKLVNSIVVPAVKSTILATMSQLSAVQIINSIGAVTVSVNPNNPTEILATVQYVPVFPLNRIKVTFTIRTQL